MSDNRTEPVLKRRHFVVEVTATQEQAQRLFEAFLHVADIVDPGGVDVLMALSELPSATPGETT